MKKYSTLLAALIFCSFTFLILKNWQISDRYVIKFDGKYAHGTFKQLAGTISFDPENPGAARFDVTVDVNSIETGIELKNKHAQSEKWFDAAKYPTIKFTSSSVSRLDSGYVVEGDLTMRGVVKKVAIPFIFRQKEPGFYGKLKINRGFWYRKGQRERIRLNDCGDFCTGYRAVTNIGTIFFNSCFIAI